GIRSSSNHDVSHGLNLAREIHRGLRPSILTHVPKLVAELIVKCWNTCPGKIPISKEICDNISIWNNNILSNESNEFTAQIKMVDET
ncbi:5893_t:CDS:1, partial [Racocetra persica]